ncbi:protein phosphatase 2C domain-containing protein [Kingella negevensis]|uniref:PP2C family protein-serine/threonine phosphatase n=1 Tax=Kingella negevensis TaxID=1522312 RepID=UPI0025433A17|nr:protein phosphatase 2C domain-containing protein [Kingella negevensis]WII92656.1 protein phosphatase 2C domain-containing protein [Kingella negevensis]
MIFQTAYFQMCGRNKSRNQDALFNGVEAKHAKMNKSRIVEVSVSPIRVAVADGVYSSEQPHLASRFWVNAWADNGACERAFFTRNFGRFCDEVSSVALGSSTTFTGVVVQGNGEFALCNIGDSRVYHIDVNGKWAKISHDHTLINEMIAKGEAEQGVEYSGVYGTLVQSLAADNESDDFGVFFAKGYLKMGETVLVCSDGLSDGVNTEDLENLWNSETDLVAKLEELRRAVKLGEFYDDCSVICVQAA